MGIFNRSNTNKLVIIEGQQELSKVQSSIVFKSILYCALGFIAIALFSFIFGAIWQFCLPTIEDFSIAWSVLLVVSIFLLLISGIVSIFWERKMLFKKSTGMTMVVWGFFIIANSLAFSMIIAVIEQSMWWLIGSVFVVAGLIFGLLGLIGYSISNKTAMTINKILRVLSIVLCSIFMLTFILGFVFLFVSSYAYVYISLITSGIFFLLIFLSTISTFNAMKNTQLLADVNKDMQGQKELNNRLSLIFGYELLVNLIAIVWIVLQFVLFFFGRSSRF